MSEERTGRGGRREGSGRKPNPAARRYARSINLNDQEWQKLQEKAALAGLTVSEYIRRVLL